MISWTPNLCLPTPCHFSLPASFKAISVKVQNKQISIMNHAQLSYPPPWEHNPAQPLGRLNPPPAKLKSINNDCNLTLTAEEGMES
jgi:hypothetical protein